MTLALDLIQPSNQSLAFSHTSPIGSKERGSTTHGALCALEKCHELNRITYQKLSTCYSKELLQTGSHLINCLTGVTSTA